MQRVSSFLLQKEQKVEIKNEYFWQQILLSTQDSLLFEYTC